jgi:hypothetical protein
MYRLGGEPGERPELVAEVGLVEAACATDSVLGRGNGLGTRTSECPPAVSASSHTFRFLGNAGMHQALQEARRRPGTSRLSSPPLRRVRTRFEDAETVG